MQLACGRFVKWGRYDLALAHVYVYLKGVLLAKAARVGMKTLMPATHSSTLQHRTGNRRFLLAADLPMSR